MLSSFSLAWERMTFLPIPGTWESVDEPGISFTATQSTRTSQYWRSTLEVTSYSIKAWLIPELHSKHPAVRLFVLPSLVVQPDAGSFPDPGHEDYASLSRNEL